MTDDDSLTAETTDLAIKTALEEALSQEDEVFIHLDSTDEAVDVPESLKGNTQLTLKISHYYEGELFLNENEIYTDLLFPEGSYTCCVPYSTIWGYTTLENESTMWPDRAPRELLENMIRKAAEHQEEDTTENEKEPAQAKTGSKSPAKLTRVK